MRSFARELNMIVRSNLAGPLPRPEELLLWVSKHQFELAIRREPSRGPASNASSRVTGTTLLRRVTLRVQHRRDDAEHEDWERRFLGRTRIMRR